MSTRHWQLTSTYRSQNKSFNRTTFPKCLNLGNIRRNLKFKSLVRYRSCKSTLIHMLSTQEGTGPNPHLIKIQNKFPFEKEWAQVNSIETGS